MLTVKINDNQLEKYLTQKAVMAGKSTGEMVKELLLQALPENKERLDYQKMDPLENGYIT